MIVTPLCSSSVSPPRLVPRAETSAAEHAASIPTALLSRCGGPSDRGGGGICPHTDPLLQVPRLYCNAQTLTYSMLSRNTTVCFSFQWKHALESPSRFWRNIQTPGLVCVCDISSEWSKCSRCCCFYKKKKRCMLELFRAPNLFYNNLFSIILKVPKL